MTNDILASNIERWSKFNSEAAKSLLNLNCQNAHIVSNTDGSLNLKLIHNGKETVFHANAQPEEDAFARFSMLDLKNIEVIFVYGVGLGYFYEAAKSWLKVSSGRHLVFVEDNLEVIRKLLETERGVEILHDEQVVLAYIDPEGKAYDNLASFFVLKQYIFIASPLYKEIKNQKFQEIKSRLAFYMNLRTGVTTEFRDYGKGFFKNFFQNLFQLPEAYLGNKLFGMFKEVPAIICGAGPSLAKNVEILKTLSDKAIIFAGGTSMNALNAADFLPHFGVGIDPNPAQFTRLVMNKAFEVPFFYRGRLLNDALKMVNGDRLYITGSSGYDIAAWIEEKLGIQSKDISEGYNVVNFSLSIAQAMGCNPIILVGLDLAYTNMESYAPGITNHPLHPRREFFKTKSIDEELLSKEDIYGQPTFTLWKWITESAWYSQLGYNYPELIVINSTEGGIGFQGIPNIDLKLVADKLLLKQYDFSGNIAACIQNSGLPERVNKEKIKESLKEMHESLKRCVEFCQTVTNDFRNYEMTLKNGQEMNDSILSEQALQALVDMEQEPGYKYILKAFGENFSELYTREYQRLAIDEQLLSIRELELKRAALNGSRYSFLVEAASVTRKTIESILTKESEDNLLNLTRIDQKSNPSQPSIPEEEKYPQMDQSKAIKRFYSSGTLFSEHYEEDDLLNGTSTFFAESGEVLSRAYYMNGRKHGQARTYYKGGSLHSNQNYKHGIYDGQQLYFYADGKIKSIFNYSEGLLDGEVKLYYPHGRLHRELAFKKGKRDGCERVWNEVGGLIIEAQFSEDKPIGTARKWFDNGNMAIEVIYEEDITRFKYREWDKYGALINDAYKKRTEDYFDTVAQHTSELTEALEEVFKQVKDVAPMIEVATAPERKMETVLALNKELNQIGEEVKHLHEINKKLLYETGLDPSNPLESIWKSPYNRREVEREVDIMTKVISDGMNSVQNALLTTLNLLVKKLDKTVQEKKNLPSGQNSNEPPKNV